MKNINNTSLINIIKSKGLLLISSSFLLTSCIIYTGGYSETDGVYYDPNKDSLPAGSYANNTGNQVDDYYSYQDTYPSIYDNNQQNIQDQQGVYSLQNDSDWGSFTGTETNYYNNNWGYGGMGMGFGWGYPSFYGGYYGFNSFGWGFGWGHSFYSPWGFSGYYNPFYGYGGYGGWGWGGYYGGYYGNYYRPNYRRSGSNGRMSGIPQNRMSNNSGFRGINSSMRPNNGVRNQANNFPNGSIRNNGIRPNNGVRTYPNNGGVRNYPNNSGTRTNNYPNSSGTRSQSNGGFRNDTYSAPTRSGGNSSGGFNSGGGFRSGGSSGGGGTRSGGGGGRR